MCKKGCCTIKSIKYTEKRHNVYDKYRKKKGGVLMYDKNEDKVLIIQSRGNLWGLPKGTIQFPEIPEDCAVREVKEETGLDVDKRDFLKHINIRGRATYFYMEKRVCIVDIQNSIQNNDANGIGWIKPDCLVGLIKKGHVNVNEHCRLVFREFLDKELPKSDFIVIKRKDRSQSF